MTAGRDPAPSSGLGAAIERMVTTSTVDGLTKGIPAGKTLRLDEVGRQGWNLLGGDVPLPALVLNWGRLQRNVLLLQALCDRRGAWLAPHGKTTMAPQIFAEQLAAGAWGISVANVAQLQVAVAFDVPRVLVANEMVSDYDVRYIAGLLGRDRDLELYTLVDSAASVALLADGLRRSRAQRPLKVLAELGVHGGRTGARTVEDLVSVAAAVLEAADVLELAGVEGYEGAIAGDPLEERLRRVDRFLDELAEAARRVGELDGTDGLLVSAGGSVFFDRALAKLGPDLTSGAQLVLRCGMYAVHDSGKLALHGPLGSGPRRLDGEGFEEALEAWSVVLSRPEPGLAILGIGRRDVPLDPWLPSPRRRSDRRGALTGLDDRYRITAIHDQHAFLVVPPDSELSPGDLVSVSIPHACGGFEKWRIVLTADDALNVTGAVRTYF